MTAWYTLENAADIPSPTLLIYADRVRENLKRMIAWAGPDGPGKLRPHVKTHKLPQIVSMKLELGITKFKTSTIAEAEMTATAGGKDVLLAYQPVGPNIGRLLKLIKTFPETHFSTIVDDVTVADSLASAAEAQQTSVACYVDLNVGMDRTGIAVGEKAAELYRLLCNRRGLTPAGLHAYDGHLHEADEIKLRAQAEAAFAPVWKLKQQLESEGLPVPSVVGCGTPTSKMMAAEHDIEVSSGTSVLWDAGQPTFTPPLDIQNAAVLLARVISRPTGNRICLDLGHKAVASEMQPPRVTLFGLEEARAVMHSEEHLVLETERAGDFPPGTVLYGVPTHICPTVALESEVWCVRNQRATEKWPVVARTRCLTI